VQTLYISYAAQGAGIGKSTMWAAEKMAAKYGAGIVALNTPGREVQMSEDCLRRWYDNKGVPRLKVHVSLSTHFR
jgi:GNAT superfamily N-acetyltransferase